MKTHFLGWLRSTFARYTQRPALVYQGRTWTYAELTQTAEQVAGRLQSLGVAVGEPVVLWSDDKLHFLLAHLGTLWAGAASVPLNPKLTLPELRYYLQDTGARFVIVGPEQQSAVESLQAELGLSVQIVPQASLHESKEHTYQQTEPSLDDPCLLIYSSGTTGWPKGIVHTQANAAAGLAALQACWRLVPDDTILNVLPLFHVHGLCFATQLPWLTGACVVLHDRFQPETTLAALPTVSVFMAVPTIYYRLLEQPDALSAAARASQLRLCTCGSAPVRVEILPELEKLLGKPVLNRYGMTEGFVLTSLPLDGPWPTGSVGLPVAGIELSVVDEAGQPVPVAVPGSVRVRGPNLFQTYWRKPDETRLAFATGWFETGDLGYLDSAGFLTLVGRKNDLIITNGFNVYPQVVERVVHECAGVAECAVFGLPDDRKGEIVAVAVVKQDPTLSPETLQAWWSSRLVAYQRPSAIYFVESLPRNSLGKVIRRELRAALVGGV